MLLTIPIPPEPSRAATFEIKLYLGKSKDRECFPLLFSIEFPKTSYADAKNSFQMNFALTSSTGEKWLNQHALPEFTKKITQGPNVT